MEITTNLIFLFLGIGFLLYFSWLDLKRSEIENERIFTFFLIGLCLLLINKQYLTYGLVIGFMGLLAVVLWYFNSIGGADVKIIACLPLYMSFSGIPNALVKFWFFMIIFGICGVIYWAFAKYILKNKEIPFLPIITLSFILVNLLKIN